MLGNQAAQLLHTTQRRRVGRSAVEYTEVGNKMWDTHSKDKLLCQPTVASITAATPRPCWEDGSCSRTSSAHCSNSGSVAQVKRIFSRRHSTSTCATAFSVHVPVFQLCGRRCLVFLPLRPLSGPSSALSNRPKNQRTYCLLPQAGTLLDLHSKIPHNSNPFLPILSHSLGSVITSGGWKYQATKLPINSHFRNYPKF